MGVLIAFPTQRRAAAIDADIRAQSEAAAEREGQRELERRCAEQRAAYNRAVPTYRGLPLGPATKAALARARIPFAEAATMTAEEIRERGCVQISASSMEKLRALACGGAGAR